MSKGKERVGAGTTLHWVGALLVLALVGGGMWHIGFKPAPQPQAITASVVRGDIEDSVLATGNIGAAKLVSVGAQVTGQVKTLHVQLGDKVKQGQPIAEIDALPQQNALRNAQAQVQSTEAQLRARQAARMQADLSAKRQRELVAADAGARADLEAAEATLNTAQAEVEALQAQLSQAKIAQSTAQLNLSYTRVTAPISGVVVAVVTEQGQTVNANQTAPTIIKLAQLDTMTVKAQISEADVPRVKAGLPVYFNLLGEADLRIEATLRAVEPGPTTIVSDGSGLSNAGVGTGASAGGAIYYNGIFEVPNPDGKLRINMTAQTTIVLARVKDVLTVPSVALGPLASDGSYSVRVLKNGLMVDKSVRIGLNNRVWAQVLEGLTEGEEVVTSEVQAAGGSQAQIASSGASQK